MPVNDRTRTLREWPTLNTKNNPYEIGDRGLVEAVNVEHTRLHKMRRRRGASQVHAGTIESAWSDGKDTLLFLEGGSLYLFNGGGGDLVRSGLTPGGRLTAQQLGNNIYYSNGFETGVISKGVDRSLGIDPPAPVLFSVDPGGYLEPGVYQATSTFVRSDGQESGTSRLVVIEITEKGSITFTLPSTSDPSITGVNIYLSSVNGSELFLAGHAVTGEVTLTFNGPVSLLQQPARTMFMDKPRAFNDIGFFNSRMLYAVGKFLVYTEPFAYELVDRRYNYVPLGSTIRMVGPMEDGVYVGTDAEAVYLSGRDPGAWTHEVVVNSPTIPGIKAFVPRTVFGEEGQREDILIFGTQAGIIAGLPGGQVANLSEKFIDVPADAQAGAAMFKQENGQNHVVVALKS